MKQLKVKGLVLLCDSLYNGCYKEAEAVQLVNAINEAIADCNGNPQFVFVKNKVKVTTQKIGD